MNFLDREQARGSDARTDWLLAEAASAAGAARERITNAVAELGMAQDRRLSDATRATMTRLLAALVAAVEDDLRQRLIGIFGRAAPAMLIDTLGATDVAIAAPILGHGRVLRDTDLTVTLLRRVEEQRLVAALAPAGLSRSALFDDLLQDGDEPLAAAAMALIVAESRRADALDGSLLARTDLPAEQQHRLVWRVAAALSHYILARAALPPAVVDRAMIAAANAALAGYDEGATAEGRATHVARRLHHRGRLDGAIARRAFEEGRLVLGVALLAVRGSIDYTYAWEMVVDTGGSRLLVLLRASGFDRADAAAIAALLGAAEGASDDDIALRIEAFDRLDAAAAREAIRLWQFDSGYRQALADLSAGLGGGSRR